MCVGAGLNLENVVLSKERAVVGETLTATCDVLNEDQTRILVYWIRLTPDQRVVEISVNLLLNHEFRNTGRYSLGYVMLNDDMRHLRFQLNITGTPPC